MKNSHKKLKILFLGESSGFISRKILRGVLSMRTEGFNWEIRCIQPSITVDELEKHRKQAKFDGIIARGLSPELARSINQLSTPCIFIRASEDESAEYINGPHVDDKAIGRLAGEEFSLLNLGYWGFVHWDGVMWSDARRRSFHSYATARAVNNETLCLPAETRHSWAAVETISKWLAPIPKPCGILACNDQAGIDVINAANKLGLSVPQEVAVIGVDNDRLLCETTSPSLSSIDLRGVDIGRAAAVALAKAMGILKEDAPSMLQPAKTVVRESSHEINKSMLTYQKALDYLAAQSLKGTSVSKLATACGVSRRGLERAFEKSTDTSPAVLIREMRIKAITDLLRDKSSTIESISQQAGFSEASGLSNFVKRMTGKSPGEFRGEG
ncbi:MAG: substrate-binding domain-containing protein [Rubritalea sp.]|uniref:substrate-binding domain-containing protein n=1 Tax=Rubritalea sp. TaxID=2109375 RepID=UPI003241D951